jgi:hypothetical protein
MTHHRTEIMTHSAQAIVSGIDGDENISPLEKHGMEWNGIGFV